MESVKDVKTTQVNGKFKTPFVLVCSGLAFLGYFLFRLTQVFGGLAQVEGGDKAQALAHGVSKCMPYARVATGLLVAAFVLKWLGGRKLTNQGKS